MYPATHTLRCPGCQSLHLIADRLGFFGDEDFDVEKAMSEQGGKFQRVTDEHVFEMFAPPESPANDPSASDR